ncbi:unnamed protein product [Albugo candida]|nr:unnamed protein product [Albugo candida]|eukprot:CCI47232.1 unnamed protein product [Albugo candida]
MSIPLIGVRLAENIPVARQLKIEPNSADDWELIQLLTDEMETQILQQNAVFNDRQTVPIFTSRNLIVFIKPILNEHNESVRITADTELHVIPKMRTSDANSDIHFETSQPLLIEEFGDDALGSLANTGTICYVHPDTFTQIHGVLPSNLTPETVLKLPIVAVWDPTKRRKQSGSEAHGVSTNQLREAYVDFHLVLLINLTLLLVSLGVGFLKCTTHLLPGRILLSNVLATHLFQGSVRDTVQLRLLRIPPLVPSSTRVNVTIVPKDSYQDVDLQSNLKQLIVEYLQSHASSWIVWDSFELDLALPQVLRCSLQFQMNYIEIVDEDSALSNSETTAPFGAFQRYTLLSQFVDQIGEIMHISISPKDSIARDTLCKASDFPLEDPPIWELSRTTLAYSTLRRNLFEIFDYKQGFARVKLGVSLPTNSLLYGQSGVGKSIICRTLARDLSRLENARVYSILQDCRELKGLKMKSVLAKLSELWDVGRVRAPALIVLDNLDAIAPKESDSAGTVNEQSREIANHLRDLMQKQADRIAEFISQLKDLSEQESKKVAKLTVPKEAHKRLIQSIGYALLSKTIACVGIALSGDSTHEILIGYGCFESTIQQPKPNHQIRQSFLKGLMSSKSASHLQCSQHAKDEVELVIDFEALAIHTEGYNFRDLSIACTRAYHRMFSQHAKTMEELHSTEIAMKMTTEIFKAAIKYYQTPSQSSNMMKSSIKWTDVGGLLSVRSVLRETLEYPVRYSKLYEMVPIKLPAGLLLYGPPGCGKTLIASAVAAECGLNFISVKGPEVLSKYIGASEQAIRDLFSRAASAAPCILFLDEIDSITPRRGSENTGVTDRIVNQLLTFLDGVESRKGIYILGATSRPDMIDPAILRPGRLDKSLYCGTPSIELFWLLWAHNLLGFPTENERLDILRVVSQHSRLSEEALDFLPVLAALPQSTYYTGADLNAILSTARLELVHEKIGSKSKIDLAMTRIEKRHLEAAALKTKPSIDSKKRREYEGLYRNFSKSDFIDLSLSDVDASASIAKLQKADVHPQRIALA